MNCSKWALTLAELDASDLIRLVSHSASQQLENRPALTHCQRGRKPKGLLPAIAWELCLLKIRGICTMYCMHLCVRITLLWLCMTLCMSTAYGTLHECMNMLSVYNLSILLFTCVCHLVIHMHLYICMYMKYEFLNIIIHIHTYVWIYMYVCTRNVMQIYHCIYICSIKIEV